MGGQAESGKEPLPLGLELLLGGQRDVAPRPIKPALTRVLRSGFWLQLS